MASTLKVNTLESASGSTITIPTGKTLVGTDTVSIKAPGMVVQVVHSTFNTQVYKASTSTSTTGHSATITPKYSNSIIVIHCMMGGEVFSSSNTGIGFKVLKDSTEIYNNDYAIYNSSNNAQRIDQVPILFKETSGSTSARTYKVQASRRSSDGTARVNAYGESCMTIMEIAQ